MPLVTSTAALQVRQRRETALPLTAALTGCPLNALRGSRAACWQRDLAATGCWATGQDIEDILKSLVNKTWTPKQTRERRCNNRQLLISPSFHPFYTSAAMASTTMTSAARLGATQQLRARPAKAQFMSRMAPIRGRSTLKVGPGAADGMQ